MASEKNLKIDSGLVNLRGKDAAANDIGAHKFAKRASVNFANNEKISKTDKK